MNRFNLGTNRTLTLINGRRFISSNAATIFGPAAPGLQVDLNFVPTILLDSVENLTVGGAPTYGSDAIAGVVNVKLKKNFEGLNTFAQTGTTSREDADNFSVGAVYGVNFADGRGNVTTSVQHSQSDSVLATDRERSGRGYFYATNPQANVTNTQPGRTPANDGRVNGDVGFNTGNADGIPNTVLIRDRRIFSLTYDGLVLPATGAVNLPDGRLRGFGANSSTHLNFDSAGNLVPYDPGTNFGTVDASGGDGLNLQEVLPLLADLERTSFTLSAHYDLTDNVSAFFDTFGYTSKALEPINQPVYNATLFAGTGGAIVFPASHPLLTAQAQATLADNGITSFRLSRANRDLVIGNAESESDLYQVVTGLEGDFTALERDWNWEMYLNYGRNKSTFFNNQLDRQKFVNALNVTTGANGQVVCTASPTTVVTVGGEGPIADPNCVPLDVFGEGRASDAARAYVTNRATAGSDIEQRMFNINLGSSLFDVWGGPVGFNVGYEYRKESSDFQPNEFLRRGLGRSVAIQPTQGAFSTNEFFGEIFAPILSSDNEVPFAERVSLTGKIRRVDNTVNGKFTAWTYGLQWAPINDIEFRGNVTRSLRAPALTELFTPEASLFTLINDPCDSSQVTSGTKPATRQANCAQFYQQYGITGPFQSNARSATVMGTTTGDPNLENESANAWTAGVVLRPRFIDNLQLAVDWIDIRIDNVIVNLNAAALATGCFDNDSYPNTFCDRFTRDASGQITSVRQGFANGDFMSTTGVTAEATWSQDLSRWGTLQLGASYYGLRELLNSTTGIVLNDTQGTIGTSRHNAKLEVDYGIGPFSAQWEINYISSAQYNRTFIVEAQDILKIDDYYLNDASVAYDFTEKGTIRLAVTNVFDEEPPFPAGGIGVYDILGRRFSLSLTYDFL